jgi:hypothetical protein
MKGAAIVAGSAALAVMAIMMFAKGDSMAEGEQAPTSVSSKPPSEWTPKSQDQIAVSWKSTIDAMAPYAVTEEDRQRFGKCFMRRFVAAFPDGPAEAVAAGKDRVQSKIREVGVVCGQEFLEWISTSKSWTRSVIPTFVYFCANGEGGENRADCTCAGENASKYYRTPTAFFQAMKKLETGASMSPEERKTIERLVGSCLEHKSWTTESIQSVVEGCLEAGEKFRDYCTCLGKQVPKYYENPGAFSAAGNPEEQMSPSERAVYERFTGACSAHLPQ